MQPFFFCTRSFFLSTVNNVLLLRFSPVRLNVVNQAMANNDSNFIFFNTLHINTSPLSAVISSLCMCAHICVMRHSSERSTLHYMALTGSPSNIPTLIVPHLCPGNHREGGTATSSAPQLAQRINYSTSSRQDTSSPPRTSYLTASRMIVLQLTIHQCIHHTTICSLLTHGTTCPLYYRLCLFFCLFFPPPPYAPACSRHATPNFIPSHASTRRLTHQQSNRLFFSRHRLFLVH